MHRRLVGGPCGSRLQIFFRRPTPLRSTTSQLSIHDAVFMVERSAGRATIGQMMVDGGWGKAGFDGEGKWERGRKPNRRVAPCADGQCPGLLVFLPFCKVVGRRLMVYGWVVGRCGRASRRQTTRGFACAWNDIAGRRTARLHQKGWSFGDLKDRDGYGACWQSRSALAR